MTVDILKRSVYALNDVSQNTYIHTMNEFEWTDCKGANPKVPFYSLDRGREVCF